LTGAPDDTVEEFSGVDVSSHWIDALEWGDWDRVGYYKRMSESVSSSPNRYLYGWTWNKFPDMRRPVKPMTEAQARKVWDEKGVQFSVSAGPDLEPGRVPDYTLAVGYAGESATVERYDAQGSIQVIMNYDLVDGRLFLANVTEYLLPEDGKFHRQDDTLGVRKYLFKPDGHCRLRTSLTAAPEDTVEEFSGVDVSSHWIDALEWGDWDRVGYYNA
jgi:hypothetical protein